MLLYKIQIMKIIQKKNQLKIIIVLSTNHQANIFLDIVRYNLRLQT